jgi:tryptophan synthase alpha subunit
VVGSAIVQLIEQNEESERVEAVKRYIQELRL